MISDTSPAMSDAYYRRIAEMTPAGRVRIASVQCAAVRQRFPEADEDEVISRSRWRGLARSWRGRRMGGNDVSAVEPFEILRFALDAAGVRYAARTISKKALGEQYGVTFKRERRLIDFLTIEPVH